MDKEKVVIVGGEISGVTRDDVLFSLDELCRLVYTAGGEVLERFIQRLDSINPKYFIRHGKLSEIKDYIIETEIDTVIFDDPLTPAQQRNLEDFLEIKVIDRTRLILDIFAKRAETKEGKLQVELAQLKYLLPRLTGKGIALSQQKGGIGTKGPGEKKLEIDLRRIRDRITKLTQEINKIKKSRIVKRTRRKSYSIPIVSIVGYTNSGKSTLTRALTGADVFVEDKLFATLDPKIKKLTLDNKQKILIADTVGFIQKLPHELVAAFRATLEEIKESDLIIHLIDASIEHFELQKRSVYNVLKEIGVIDIPIIEVYNKSDILDDEKKKDSHKILISAKEKTGLKRLLTELTNHLQNKMISVKLAIPYNSSYILNRLYQEAIIDTIKYQDDYIAVTAKVKSRTYKELKKMIIP